MDACRKRSLKPNTDAGYIKFMRAYSTRNKGIDADIISIKGTNQWLSLTPMQKAKFRIADTSCKVRAARKRKKCPGKPKINRKLNPCKPKPRLRCPMRRKTLRCRPRSNPNPNPRCRPKTIPPATPPCPRPPAPEIQKRKSCRKAKKVAVCKKKIACHSKYKCHRPGPITPNAYFNFMRVFRRKNCGLSPTEMVRLGARAWCRMSPSEKECFRRQACTVAKSCRHKQRRVCKK